MLHFKYVIHCDIRDRLLSTKGSVYLNQKSRAICRLKVMNSSRGCFSFFFFESKTFPIPINPRADARNDYRRRHKPTH